MSLLQCFLSKEFGRTDFLVTQSTFTVFVVGAEAKRCARLVEDASLE